MATSLELSDDLMERISKLSAERRHSVQWREEAREDFRREAEASWLEFQATGMHLTGEETRAWLRT